VRVAAGDGVTRATRLRLDGQPMRVLRFLRDHPGSSSLEITRALYVVNVTGRISDLRAAGYIVVCRKGSDGLDRYYVEEPKPVDRGIQEALAL
jgi:hypothetical protein